jgi:hypothetical protein
VAKVYSKKRLADTAGIEKYKITLCVIACLLACIFLIVIYVAISTDNLWLAISAYGNIGTAFFITLPLALNECFRNSKSKFINFNQSVKQSLEEYFEQVNP